MKKTCQNCKAEFTIEPEDFTFYEKMDVPPPTFCWLCRAQRRLAFRNERYLYLRKSDFSGKEIFSRIPPESPVKVYENEVWESDKWNPMEYGKEVDFLRPFLNQFFDLMHEVPWRAKGTVGGIHSEYSNNFTELKNCYLVFNATLDEDCLYANGISHSRDCVDNSHIIKCEFCYENFWLTSCSYTFFSSQCSDSFNLYFCKNCVGCHDCFGSVNLRNKSYCIFNKPYTKEAYQKEIKKLDIDSFKAREHVMERVREFWLRYPTKFMEGIKNTHISGEYIYSSKNVLNSYLIRGGEDLRYCQYLQDAPNRGSYDHTIFGNGTELVYESQSVGDGAYNIKFCSECWVNVRDLEYCVGCGSVSDLFGCVSLRNKNYCILNKQYSKGEYETLKKKIKKHMEVMPYKDKKGRIYTYGEFLPLEFSPFPYNQTIAQDHFLLTKEEALGQAYIWKDSEERGYEATLSWKDLPDCIELATDDILNALILCRSWDENVQKASEHNCTKVYRIVPQELAFYRRFNLPLPRRCPYSRTHERLAQRNSLKIWDRPCQCKGEGSQNGRYQNTTEHFHQEKPCSNKFQTSYAPERPEIVYCENCYLQEVA